MFMSDLNSIPQQYAWGEEQTCSNGEPIAVNFSTEEYEELITCIHNKIKEEYSDDETCRFYSKLLGKLLIAANQ